MRLIIGVLDTRIATYGPSPRLDVYLQIWDMAQGGKCVASEYYENVTHRQWQRFRRLQDALARVPAQEDI